MTEPFATLHPMTPVAAKPCPLCSGGLAAFAEGRLLGSRDVTFLRCGGCGSVLLPDPDWLETAYSEAISPLDVGLLERCVQLANVTTAVISGQRLRKGHFLDFAGGYGTLTRFMRDRGYDFRHDDPYCQNLFAQGFDATEGDRYDLITAFEVLEHLSDPVTTLTPAAAATDLFLVTTQVLPDPPPQPGQWAYYAEETGQHITFYTVGGLRALADQLGMQLTTSGKLVHLFHRGPLKPVTKLLLRDERLSYAAGAVRSELARRRGLTATDRAAAVDRVLATGVHDSSPQPGTGPTA
jgi:hypothetical protein